MTAIPFEPLPAIKAMPTTGPIPFASVGFDLDGTLLDTSIDLCHALNHALALEGRPLVPTNEVQRLIGGGAAQMLRNALTQSGGLVEPDRFKWLQGELVAFYADNIAGNTKFYPGAEAMLDTLASAGVGIAVATNKKEALAVRLFDELGIGSRFATVIGGDTLGPGKAKPAPDMIHEYTMRLGGGRTAFVGDTTFDVGAARAAGVPVVAVSFGFNDLPPADLGADAVIDHFDELADVLTRL